MNGEIKRLPKGHMVTCMYPFQFKPWLRRDGISFTEDDDKIYVQGFVSGDTESKGLSVVALDNPTVCLYHESGEESDFEVIESRKNISMGFDNWCCTKDFNDSGLGPKCPY